MGSSVGTFDDSEVEGLATADREELKKQALALLQSEEIRKILEKNPTILTRDKHINTELRKKLDPLLQQLKSRNR